MTKLEDESKLLFGGESPCCFLELKSIGSLNPSVMTKTLCSFVHEKIGIPIDKIYICFEDIPPELWGWNGKTFG